LHLSRVCGYTGCMAATTTHTGPGAKFMGYEVHSTEPATVGPFIVGEFTLVGPRGGELVTIRRAGDRTVGFVPDRFRVGVARSVRGNYSAPVATLEERAIVWTDADRVGGAR
jgi:hypothetical protein